MESSSTPSSSLSSSPSSHFMWCSTPQEWYKLHYTMWTASPSTYLHPNLLQSHINTLLCVHGLTRNGRDFDHLSSSLISNSNQDGYQYVFCPDVVGRGKSDWLSHPTDYTYPSYATSISTLISHLTILPLIPSHLPPSIPHKIDYIGTSMGGLIGMMIASLPNSPIRRLVINDIGPRIESESLQRIATYATAPQPIFESMDDVVAYFMRVHAPFGLTEDQWHHLAPHCVRNINPSDDTESKMTLIYDPNITHAFRDISALVSIEMWSMWESISCPILLLRGETSDVLSVECVEEMKKRNRNLIQVFTVNGVGHAPSLSNEQQVRVIREFLM
jgi:pimeloyl-ACP methyl ester carboxylesterase